MSLSVRFLEGFSINWVRAREPFQLCDLFELARSRTNADDTHPDLANPLLLDLREVELIRSSSSEIRTLVEQRKSFGGEYSDNPVAYLTADSGSYGMLRMFSTYAEIEGLRSAENALVSLNVNEAVRWLVARSERPDGDVAGLLNIIS